MSNKIFAPWEWCRPDTADVPNPSSGCTKIYPRDDGYWYERDENGDEVRIFPGTSDTVNPTVTDDTASGFPVGHVWVNESTNTAFILVDGATGAAVWQEVGSGSGGGDDPNSLYNRLNESYDLQINRTNCLVDSVIAHAPGDPATRIRMWDQFTYDANCALDGFRLRQYADDGTTVLETMTLTGGNVWTRT